MELYEWNVGSTTVDILGIYSGPHGARSGVDSPKLGLSLGRHHGYMCLIQKTPLHGTGRLRA
jgi:hypothetical protein